MAKRVKKKVARKAVRKPATSRALVSLREEYAQLRVERDTLKDELQAKDRALASLHKDLDALQAELAALKARPQVQSLLGIERMSQVLQAAADEATATPTTVAPINDTVPGHGC